MNCSWCNEKLPLIRSLGGSEYCSNEHKKAAMEKTRELAIQRLRPTATFRRGATTERVEEEPAKAKAVSSPQPAGA